MHEATLRLMVLRISARVRLESRKEMCCAQGMPNDRSETVGLRQVEEPLGRRRESAEAIDAELAHQRKVDFYGGGLWKRYSRAAGCKGTVCDAL